MKQSVFLSLPRLGSPEFENGVAAFVTATDDKFDVTVDPRCSSLLAFGFNQSFCRFANGAFDHFVMLHADHGPANGWLDVLLREMDGYGVMHAVAAIKDGRGLTSTALGDADDDFSLIRRITTKELFGLPETFDYGDCAKVLGYGSSTGCLLPNTGVMAVRRAGFPFDRFDGFGIRDRIDVVDGKLSPRVAPEDWRFGRWCALNGVRVGGTRKIVTHHFGRADFNTSQPWGDWETDLNYSDAVTAATKGAA